MSDTLEGLRREAGVCIACRLADRRTSVVFGEGNPAARIMLVGEAPGREEDRTGRPFVGRAGELLDRILNAVDLGRDEVFITNTVMCRPPENRVPAPDETGSCRHFLERKMALIRPPIVVALGSVALRVLSGDPRASITAQRGRRIDKDGYAIYPTFHPAALLRDPAKKRPVWEDFKRIRRDLDALVSGERASQEDS